MGRGWSNQRGDPGSGRPWAVRHDNEPRLLSWLVFAFPSSPPPLTSKPQPGTAERRHGRPTTTRRAERRHGGLDDNTNGPTTTRQGRRQREGPKRDTAGLSPTRTAQRRHERLNDDTAGSSPMRTAQRGREGPNYDTVASTTTRRAQTRHGGFIANANGPMTMPSTEL